jgi:ribosomal protein S27AE
MMPYEKTKKFFCIKCGEIGKRHNNIDTQKCLCGKCESVIGTEVTEARRLRAEGKAIPDRLMYLYTSK